MTRISISFTDANDEWLKSQVASGEFSSKTEAINHIVRKARAEEIEDDFIRQAIKLAEKSGIETRSLSQIEDDVSIRLGLQDDAA